MRTLLRLALLSSVVVGAAAASTGCSSNDCGTSDFFSARGDSPNAGAPSSSSGGYASPSPAPAAAARAIAEADIIQMDGTRLYAMSKSGSVAIVDVANPNALTLEGRAQLAGEPFEMYRSGSILLTMSNGAVDENGVIRTPPKEGEAAPPEVNHDNDSSIVTALDVTDPKKPSPLVQYVIPGQIADSRLVGNILYVATYETSACFKCGPKPRTMVTSFDVSDASVPKKVDQAEFVSSAPDTFNQGWAIAHKRSILATDKRLYVGGHADIPAKGTDKTVKEGIVDVLDITDPTGKMTKGAHLVLPGSVLSRWQMDETDGVFRVITQFGAGRTKDGLAMPEIETFTVENASTFVPLGHTSMTLPRQEGLKTVRFDGSRAFAITYENNDPLFILDFSDPAAPKQRGELEMPGFMFHLEPRGDRLLGLGVDWSDPVGSLNVSLFDVSNMDAPKMMKRVSFGAKDISYDYKIVNYELPEDQDRIQKAFRILKNGLIVVPYSGMSGHYEADQCEKPTGGVQLVQWENDTLNRKSLLLVEGNPRRAFEKDNHIVAVSDSNVSAFTLASAATAGKQVKPVSDVVIGKCVPKTTPAPQNGGYPGGDYDGPYHGGNDYGHGRDSYGWGMCE